MSGTARELLRLLIVDDEYAIRQVMATTLKQLGFEVVECSRGEQALSTLASMQIDAVLMDINMPGMGGIAACRAIRAGRAGVPNAAIPILMLSVRNGEDDKVGALEAGADDYITKPCSMRELVARVNAVLRRGKSAADVGSVLMVGEVCLCKDRRRFQKRGEDIHLTRTQYELVLLLMSNKGCPLPHHKILSSIWGPEFRCNVEYLRTFVRQLRLAIEDDPAQPQYILTVPYVGYRFRE